MMPTAPALDTSTEATTRARLRLWQLISPTLPIGAYAYSGGLEYAVESGWVGDEDTAGNWIRGLLGHTLAVTDIPLLVRLERAWRAGDEAALETWSARLRALRESAELRQEDHQLGMALARLLYELGIEPAARWRDHPCASYAALFALAAVEWDIPLAEAAHGYAWAWCENQVAAAMKLIPLGQSAGQRLLTALAVAIPSAVERGLNVSDSDIGAQVPGLGLASALHEDQYSRLFRS